MAINETSMYDIDAHIAEVYDGLWATGAEDVEAIRQFVGDRGPWRILEPFCGTGRILLPLAQDGHQLVGLDRSPVLLGRLREKLGELPAEVQQRVRLLEMDVVTSTWPTGFDLVLLGGNSLYEVGGPEEQDFCFASAAAALKPGGYLFLDNDHMEGDLEEGWRAPGLNWRWSYPCADGTVMEFGFETIWFDAPRRLHRGRRVTRATYPDGRVEEREFVIQKHPPCLTEMRGWLAAHGFSIEYANETKERATYWARR